MHIILKLIDATIVLAILMIATIALLNGDNYRSMLDGDTTAKSDALPSQEEAVEQSTPIEQTDTQEHIAIE
jgi:hypothetical protein